MLLRAKKEGIQSADVHYERKLLFHGTNAAVISKICQQGFNRSFCGKVRMAAGRGGWQSLTQRALRHAQNATNYGKGVYFGRDASYSVNPLYSRPDDAGVQRMFACHVLVGEFQLGRLDQRVPDVRVMATNTLYDSTYGIDTFNRDCVQSAEDPAIFVTYHDAQAYPAYVVEFNDHLGGLAKFAAGHGAARLAAAAALFKGNPMPSWRTGLSATDLKSQSATDLKPQSATDLKPQSATDLKPQRHNLSPLESPPTISTQEPLPDGWQQLKSRSRPGEFTYRNMITGKRVSTRPTTPAAGADLTADTDENVGAIVARLEAFQVQNPGTSSGEQNY